MIHTAQINKLTSKASVIFWFLVEHYPRLAYLKNRDWAVSKEGKYTKLEAGNTILRLVPQYATLMFKESKRWEKSYLPPFSLAGKTVLDIGAGCGESAWLFFKAGAQKVVAVEPHPESSKLIRSNAQRNGWNLELLAEPFSLNHLLIPHDFLKMDCEGCESKLLIWYRDLRPCRIELHPKVIGAKTYDEIICKFSLHRIDQEIWGKN